ncbi:hypothetical protein LTR87_014448 [Friedmanniomyces endolithicus]|nr:hypothetical protein LTR87_014448 [Friedmanniomyces endolithicus]
MSRSVQLVVLAVFAASALCLDLDISNQRLFNQPEPWFWWLSGAGWTALIDYTAYTNDTTYVSDMHTALSQNLGSNYDFVPAEQSGWEANDDQVYWVYSALTAMEYGFPPLPCKAALNNTIGNCTNSWQAVAVHAFEDFVTRWNLDSQTCGGGLKWQYDPTAKGWTYKNSVSNAGFFQTAARLARYTGNETYSDWATKIWNWSVTSGLVGSGYHVYDGSSDADGANCSSVDHDEWSYNIASYLHGAAHMSAHTNASIWTAIVNNLLDTATTTFFSPFPNATGIMYEPICEKQAACSTDQSSFKGSLANWMGKTAVLVPSVSQKIMALLGSSAQGAAAGCSGGNGTCGTKWYVGGFDGQVGFGQQLSALDAVLSLLVGDAPELAVLA